jgi:hypothetical protein
MVWPLADSSEKYSVRHWANLGDGWQGETIGTSSVGTYTIAFDGDGNPVVFVPRPTSTGDTDYDMWVATRSGSAWSLDLLDAAKSGGEEARAARDVFGRVEVFYWYYGSVRRVVWKGGTWNMEPSQPKIPLPLRFQTTPAVALGPHGEIHLVFGGWTSGVLYAYFDGCTWTSQVVDTDKTVGGDPAIAVDSSGRPHISYHVDRSNSSATADSLWYAHPSP